MDRKPIPSHEKPPSYYNAGSSSSGNEILLFTEAIIETNKFGDDGTTPAIIFQSGNSGDLYTYKKLATPNHDLHDKYRCHMHLIALESNMTAVDGARLAELISRQLGNGEIGSAKFGDKVAVEVRRLLVLWKGEESHVRRYPLTDNATQQHCCTNLLGMDQHQVGMVFKKMQMRGWIDRFAILYKLK